MCLFLSIISIVYVISRIGSPGHVRYVSEICPLSGLPCLGGLSPTRKAAIALLEALRRLEAHVESGQPARLLASGVSGK
jgi:hypothetical protein